MSLLLDAWPPAPEPPAPRTPRSRRPAWPWLVGVAGGMAAWLAALRPDQFSACATLAIALVLGLVSVWLLVRTPLSGWLIAIALAPGLILCSSATTYVSVAVRLDDAVGIHPLNYFMIGFGGIWALIAITTTALLIAARTLVRA